MKYIFLDIIRYLAGMGAGDDDRESMESIRESEGKKLREGMEEKGNTFGVALSIK